MANTTVTKVSELLLTNVTAGAKAGEQKVSEDGGFTQVLNNAKDSTANVTNDKPEDPRTSRTVVETPKKSEIKADEPVRKDPVNNEDDMAELTEEVAKEASKIFNKIVEVLGVSEDELADAMGTLGFTQADLLDPMNVKDLCMALTGIEDSISLLTNADLYESVKEIVQTAETAQITVADNFGITKEELTVMTKDESFATKVEEAVTELGKKAEAADIDLNITEAVVPQIKDIEAPKQDMDVDYHADSNAVTADIKDTNEAVRTDAATVTVEVTGKPEPKQEANPETTQAVASNDPLARTGESVTETFKATVKSEESNLKGSDEGFESASRFVDSEAISINPNQTQVVTTEVNNLGDIVETVTTYSNEDANSIMSQVTQSIRVNYSADTTSMELQLHPASLGTVNMNIASTNGVVTAHILVENEAVKAALESQLITLQQTFDEQGQKVEAVEVSVANYDLNKGSDSDSDGRSGDRKAGGTGRAGTRRRINLNDLDEEGLEDLNEDERIAADMMARSGNSVDYQA